MHVTMADADAGLLSSHPGPRLPRDGQVLAG